MGRKGIDPIDFGSHLLGDRTLRTHYQSSMVGEWADGLITISHPIEKLNEVINAFRDSGGDQKPVMLKYHLSYATSKDDALQGAYEEWKTNIFSSSVLSELRLPDQFQKAAEFVDTTDIKNHVKIYKHLDQYIDSINEHIALGLDEIILHNVHTNQEKFIEDFGMKVLPSLNSE